MARRKDLPSDPRRQTVGGSRQQREQQALLRRSASDARALRRRLGMLESSPRTLRSRFVPQLVELLAATDILVTAANGSAACTPNMNRVRIARNILAQVDDADPDWLVMADARAGLSAILCAVKSAHGRLRAAASLRLRATG